MQEREKVLVVVDDGEVRIHSSAGVDVVCIVDGENVSLPDDWTGALPNEVKHLMPINVHMSELFDDASDKEHHDIVLEPGIFVDEEETEVSHRPPGPRRTMMKAPYCSRCDENHPPGQHTRPCLICHENHADGECPRAIPSTKAVG